MKYYRSVFSQFKIYITNPMSCTSIFSCYMTMISYFFILNEFFTYSTSVTWSKIFFFFVSHDQILVKMFFHFFFTVIILSKNCFNESIRSISTAIKNNATIGLLKLLSIQTSLLKELQGMWSWYFSLLFFNTL